MGNNHIFKLSRKILLLLVGILLLTVSCATGASSASPPASPPASSPVACGSWTIINGPTPGNYYNTLNGVAAVSASDVWAVGNYADSSSPQHTLTERWNGSAWQVVASPNPSNTHNAQLFAVAALSTKDAWAVGNYNDNNNATHALIEHWNGSSWSIVRGPNPQGSMGNQLLAVTVVSANNVWAVGTSSRKQGSSTLIEHWNGSAWSIVRSANTQSPGNVLNGVTTLSSHNIWAVGTSYTQGGYPSQMLIEYWRGSTWSIVRSPNVASSQNNDLLGIAAVSGNNIWAVGRWDTGSQSYRTLIEHWNGTGWSIASSANAGAIPNALQAVTRVPASNTLWAVGYRFSTTLSAPLIERHC